MLNVVIHHHGEIPGVRSSAFLTGTEMLMEKHFGELAVCNSSKTKSLLSLVPQIKR